MNGHRSSLLRAAPAYWGCVAILLLMAGYFIARLSIGPSGSLSESFDIMVLFFTIAFAPGTFSLIVAAGALILNRQPGIFIRAGTYITTLFFIGFTIALSLRGTL